MNKCCGLFNYVSVTWRVDDFSKWNSWTEKMLAVELESQTLTGPVYVQRTSHLRVLWFLKIVTNYISKACCSLVHGIDFVTWQTYVNLCCNYWIRRDNSLHQQKEFWLCNIWCLFCYDFNASCVFVFVVRFFGLSLSQIYHICKFIIYANLSYMHADFANQNFRLPLYERRKFLIIIFQWCSINGNANLSRREEKRLTVFTH